nr:hypothetical protein [Tanacetum cinerariifolium]
MESKDTLSSCSNSEAQQTQQIQDKAKKSCMVSFHQLHSHLKRLLQNDLQGSRTESGFKRPFATLSGQDIETFTGTMFLNVEQLEKQLDKEDFQEIGSMAAFNVNERQMQKTEERVDTSKALDASSVDTECSRTESKEQDTSSSSGNDAHDDVDIRPIYDEEPMAEVQTTAKINVFAIGKQHTEQPEFKNEEEVVQNAEECHDTCPLPTIFIDNQIPEHSYQSLEYENSCLKKTIAQFQKDFSSLEAHCINLELKYQNQGQGSQLLKYKSNKAKVKHDIDEREAASAKPHHMIVYSNSRISSKNMTRFSSNDMVHNHYLKEAKKRTQERSRNSEPSLIPSARLQSTNNGSKPMPKRNTQTFRIWPATKNSFVTTKTVPIAKHPRNSRNVSCVTKFLKEVNSHAKVPSNKTTNRNIPVEQKGVPNKPERQIPTGYRFSIQKTFVVQKKTMTPRSCLRWKPTGKIFKTVGLRWVPTGRILTTSTTKIDSEPLNGSNTDITNQYECEQTLDVSSDISETRASRKFLPMYKMMNSDHNSLELGIHDHSNELSSSKLVRDVYADVPSQQELDILFGPLYDEFFNAGSNPSMKIPSTSAPSTHTNVHAEENNNDQAEE